MTTNGKIIPFRGHTPRIADDAWIADGAILIGDVEVGPGSGIWFGAVLRGDGNKIRIGARTNIQDGSVIHVSRRGEGTIIGDDITVGHMALLHACRLESGCFIGMKACVMDGAVVESGGMVAAGALITPNKRVRTGELWVGAPAKLARHLSEAERAHLVKSPAGYAQLAQAYRVGVSPEEWANADIG